jgi:hypothetical protein
MISKFNKLQKLILLWYIIFTIICIVNIVYGIVFDNYKESNYSFAFILPFIQPIFLLIFYIIYTFYYYFNFYEKKENIYIKENYPHIWKKLHPWGDFSINGFAGIMFMMGKYDDNHDKQLNEIRYKYRNTVFLTILPFIIIIFSWTNSIILLAIKFSSTN